MRIAAIYDIHGNLPALEAVLAGIKQEAVDQIVVGGDVVAGPMPVESLNLLQNSGIPTHYIHGNAESEVLRHLAGKPINGLSPQAEGIAKWVGGELTAVQKQFIATWPTTYQIDVNGIGTVMFCHATPQNDISVFTKLTPETKLLPIFQDLPASMVVCGHTHMQFDRTVGNVRVVNAGSVGMSFGKTGAFWLLIDKTLSFKQTDYDRIHAADRIRQTSYPQAENFAANNVLNAPTEEQALNLLSNLEAQQANRGIK
jgi:putative phosphoesterase